MRVRGLIVGTAMLSLLGAASAGAAPTVRFRAKATPIAGFVHTGNIAGAGAAIETEVEIDGTEYGGFAPPLVHVNLYLPAGVKLHPEGFPVCRGSTLEPEALGPRGCPAG